MARAPKGGDTDQIKAVASGECGVALTNTYYLARIMRSNAPEDKLVADRVGVVFPNQATLGHARQHRRRRRRQKCQEPGQRGQVHGIPGQPRRAKLLCQRQQRMAGRAQREGQQPGPQAMTGGSFKSETIPVSAVGYNQIKVQQMLDRVGYK